MKEQALEELYILILIDANLRVAQRALARIMYGDTSVRKVSESAHKDVRRAVRLLKNIRREIEALDTEARDTFVEARPARENNRR